jgi:peptide/nickel transport system ATP-binding protein
VCATTSKAFGNPQHPYTRTLAAVPRPGAPAQPAEPLTTCAFRTAGGTGGHDGEMHDTEPGHFAACARLPDCGRTPA